MMAPTVEGEVENGVQLPLRVSLAPRDVKGVVSNMPANS